MTTLFIVLLVLAASAAVIAQVVWWVSGRPEAGRVPPPLVVPIHPQFLRHVDVASIDSTVDDPATAPRVAETRPVAAAAPAAPAAPLVPTAPPVTIALAGTVEPELDATETVRFSRPGDEALQLLPARLEVVSGITPKQAIRFVRVPGQPPEMILGREVASSPQQVTLTSSTVSRRHARVTYVDGRWLVTNLSRTNPVVVNDEALAEFEGARPLLDGDRIELGDVVLRFCTS